MAFENQFQMELYVDGIIRLYYSSPQAFFICRWFINLEVFWILIALSINRFESEL